MNRFKLLVVGLVLFFTISGANAGFIGNTIEASACFPTLVGCGISGGPVSKVVDASVEFVDGEFLPFFGPTFDFDDTTITITHAATGHSSGDFNGYIFNDINATIDDIVGVSILSDNSGFFLGDPGRISFDMDNLFINFESLFFSSVSDPEIVLSVAFASVPEPSIIALFAVGLVGIGFARRRQPQ